MPPKKPVVLRAIAPPTAGVDALSDLVDAAREWAVTREVESTRRREIAAQERAATAEISARSKLVCGYLHACFTEREALQSSLLRALHGTLERRDESSTQQLLEALMRHAEANPLDGLCDLS